MKRIICVSILLSMCIAQAGKKVVLNWKPDKKNQEAAEEWTGKIKINEGKSLDKLPNLFELIAKGKDRKKILIQLNKLSKEQVLAMRDTKSGANPLHYAVKKDRKRVMGYLIDKAPELLITPDKYGRIPLHWAAEEEGKKVFNELLDKYRQEQLNYKDNLGRTPLHWTVARGRNKYVEHLIKKGADVTIQDNLGFLPLHYAVSIRYHKSTESNFDKIGKAVGTAGGAAIAAGTSVAIAGAGVGAAGVAGTAALAAYPTFAITTAGTLAAGATTGALVAAGLAAAVGVSAAGLAIDDAIKKDKENERQNQWHDRRDRIIKTLIAANKSTVNTQGFMGMTPLHIAAQANNGWPTEYLLKQGADQFIHDFSAKIVGDKIEVVKEEGALPIHYAAAGSHRAFKALRDGANKEQLQRLMSAKDANGSTVVHYAAGDSVDAMKLVQKTCESNNLPYNLAVQNNLGLAPLHIACERKSGKTVDYILKQIPLNKASFAVREADIQGNTPLHYAAMNNMQDVCKILIYNGADIDAKNKEGKTPVDIAREYNHYEVVKILYKKTDQYDDSNLTGRQQDAVDKNMKKVSKAIKKSI